MLITIFITANTKAYTTTTSDADTQTKFTKLYTEKECANYCACTGFPMEICPKSTTLGKMYFYVYHSMVNGVSKEKIMKNVNKAITAAQNTLGENPKLASSSTREQQRKKALNNLYSAAEQATLNGATTEEIHNYVLNGIDSAQIQMTTE